MEIPYVLDLTMIQVSPIQQEEETLNKIRVLVKVHILVHLSIQV